jgi:nicotinamide phosphoribosyltransferase
MYAQNPLMAIDFYKTDHRRQYPEGTTKVYSNWTPRSGKHSNVPDNTHVVVFGLQAFMMAYLQDQWNKGFFQMPKAHVCNHYKNRMDKSLGKDAVSIDHIEALHDLGYLPIQIKALPEGTRVPYGVPMFTIENTHPDFFWLTNYLETVLSTCLWKPCTSATTAFAYKKRFLEHCRKTGSPLDFVQWQGHDFSSRGMGGVDDGMASGAGHLLSFTGTDAVNAIDYLENYYGAVNDFVGGSIPATEHSVMCMGGDATEFETVDRLITEIYPSGNISIVADTWDFWKLMTDFLPRLKDKIMARDGRVVIRPDSGDPVKIVCGDPLAGESHVARGAYQCLWDTFGGTVNEKGYKILDQHIGLIYGDAITLVRQDEMLTRLTKKGFAASNLVLGIGSYTYVYCSRDTHGFAMKATYGEVTDPVTGEVIKHDIYKDPKTDDGLKKSARGKLAVVYDEGGELFLCQGEDADFAVFHGEDLLRTVFANGHLYNPTTLSEIRERLDAYHD